MARVARRLNRVTVQRALYRSLAVVLFAASALAACAAWLTEAQFRWAFAGLAAAVVLLVALALHAARASWAGPLEAARWIERQVPLDARLLTLVSASHARSARLWPELLADNRAQLPRWADERLGIATVPPSILLLLAALVCAWLFLVPWYESVPEPVPAPAKAPAAAAQQGAPGAGGAGGARPGPPVRGPKAGETLPGGAAPDLEGVGAVGALAELQSSLARSFERSLGGSTVIREGSKASDRSDPITGERGDVEESGLGSSAAEEGGRVPDEELARREKDDGTGQSVARAGGDRQGGTQTRTGSGQRGREAEPRKQAGAEGEALGGGRPAPGGNAPADGPLAQGAELGGQKQAGGAGAGSAKATEPLLAKQPLTLSGGRHRTRFALTLGGASGSGASGGPKSMVAKPASRIAEAERGAQDPASAVRHEAIPAEYESVVKQIFKREP